MAGLTWRGPGTNPGVSGNGGKNALVVPTDIQGINPCHRADRFVAMTLLATHFNGQPLTVGHGAPLRLLLPVKPGLKNVKAITKITYAAEEPRDYCAARGYSRYDGI